MSVVRVCRKSTGATASEDENYHRTFTQVFLVETNDKDDGPLVVFHQMELVGPHPVPVLWSTYNQQTGTYGAFGDAFLQQRDISRLVDSEDAPFQWQVTCVWKIPSAGNSGSDPPNANPLLDPVKYSLEWTNYTKQIDVDINGDPITNGAGDEFDPPIQRDDYRPVLVAVRNMYPFTDIVNLALVYKNVVNSDAFYGAPAQTAKVESIASGPLLERNGIPYYAVTIRVQFIGIGTGTADPNNNWLVRLVNRGRHFIDGDGKKKVPFEMQLIAGAPIGSDIAAHYEQVTPRVPLEFVNLTGTGGRKFPDYAPADLTGTAFQIYPAISFSGLGI